MATTIEWSGDDGIIAGMLAYEKRVYEAIRRLAEYFAPVIETYAKDNAPWTDRTGNARQGLQGLTEDISESIVAIVLKHGVDYGIWLELMAGGRYSIIGPALEAHYGEVLRILKEVFE